MSQFFDPPMPTLCGVSRNQKIHRIVDFFSAAQIIEENKLYVPLASKFEDPNEGIDASLEILAISGGPCAGITAHFGSTEELIEHQRSIAKGNYVSCWTSNRESVAMWALYSRDFTAVQLTTTVAKIEAIAIELSKKSSDPHKMPENGLIDRQILDQSRIAAVQYEEYASLANKLQRRRMAYDKIEAKQFQRLVPKPDIQNIRELFRADQYKFATLEHKDASFSHEAEIRLILTYTPYTEALLGEANVKWSALATRDDYKKTAVDYERYRYGYVRAYLRENALKMKLSCVPHMTVPVPAEFITEATIDPRCPQHKAHFIRSFLGARGIKVASSTCFGYSGAEFKITPRNKLLQPKI